MNPFRSLDDLLFDRLFQPFCDLVQVRWGKTCFGLSKTIIDLIRLITTAWFFALVVLILMGANVLSDAFSQFVLAGTFWLVSRRTYVEIDALEELVLANRTVNRLRLIMMPIRFSLSLVVFIVAPWILWRRHGLTDLSVYFFMASMWVYMYVIACTPMPPRPKLQSQPVGTGRLAPQEG